MYLISDLSLDDATDDLGDEEDGTSTEDYVDLLDVPVTFVYYFIVYNTSWQHVCYYTTSPVFIAVIYFMDNFSSSFYCNFF